MKEKVLQGSNEPFSHLTPGLITMKKYSPISKSNFDFETFEIGNFDVLGLN